MKARVVHDETYPDMRRVRWPDGQLSDMVNLSRAYDAAARFNESLDREYRGRGKPSEAPYVRSKCLEGCVMTPVSASLEIIPGPICGPLSFYGPDGRNPEDHCDGNDDPDENAQPSAHAVWVRRRHGRETGSQLKRQPARWLPRKSERPKP
jgi:hypothetical protein